MTVMNNYLVARKKHSEIGELLQMANSLWMSYQKDVKNPISEERRAGYISFTKELRMMFLHWLEKNNALQNTKERVKKLTNTNINSFMDCKEMIMQFLELQDDLKKAGLYKTFLHPVTPNVLLNVFEILIFGLSAFSVFSVCKLFS
ncbi:hypothetical protein [Bacillus sp. NPDC094106]|uniref:hypothetical protein n=1 Tax=Bacillus sp. NPDC094106 TaxID=3363949 RepID=UPI0038233DAF